MFPNFSVRNSSALIIKGKRNDGSGTSRVYNKFITVVVESIRDELRSTLSFYSFAIVLTQRLHVTTRYLCFRVLLVYDLLETGLQGKMYWEIMALAFTISHYQSPRIFEYWKSRCCSYLMRNVRELLLFWYR